MTKDTRSLISRSIKRTGLLLTTAATGALALGLVVVAAQAIASRAVSIDVKDPAPAVTVDTMRLQIEDGYETYRAFVGQLEAPQAVPLGFEQGGTLVEVLVDEGDRVKAGQTLARLDTRTLLAERAAQDAAIDALMAQAELAGVTRKRQEELEKRGFSATQAYDQARLGEAEIRARIAQTQAGLRGIDIALDKAVLRAPFAGVIGARFADPGATTAPGQAVLSVLAGAAPQMRIGLPVDLAATVSPGTTLVAEIGGQRYPATVTSLRPDLDPGTRTRSVLLTLEAATGTRPAFGQTGTVRFSQHVATRGAWVPLSALQEGTRGLWTILTIMPETQTIAREAVEVLHATGERAFVRGTFRPGALAVRTGPHRVVPGQPILIAGN